MTAAGNTVSGKIMMPSFVLGNMNWNSLLNADAIYCVFKWQVWYAFWVPIVLWSACSNSSLLLLCFCCYYCVSIIIVNICACYRYISAGEEWYFAEYTFLACHTCWESWVVYPILQILASHCRFFFQSLYTMILGQVQILFQCLKIAWAET